MTKHLTDEDIEELGNSFRSAAWLDDDPSIGYGWAAYEDDAIHKMTPVIEAIVTRHRAEALREALRATAGLVPPLGRTEFRTYLHNRADDIEKGADR